MEEETSIPFSQISFKNRFFYLFISILVLFFLSPFIEGFAYLQILFTVFLTAIFLSAIYAISHNKLSTFIATILAIPMIASAWSMYLTDSVAVFIVGRFCGVVFLAFTITHILIYIFRQDEVTRDLIIGAAVVYLLLAIMWFFAYQILELLRPGSFAFPDSQLQDTRHVFMYYSVVTITTLGYGDVTPVTSVARSLSAFEAIVGQLFLVITVAWLVGVHASQSKSKKSF